jgi:signal recognition particle subunit SRP54
MFNNLQEKLESAFKNLKGQGRITELNIATTLKEIRRALVDADVNYKIAKEFTDKVKDKAIGEKVINAISPGQLMTKIVKDELCELMGGQEAAFNAKGNPAIILIAGLQGSGKTTFSGKLANFLKTKKGLSPMLVAADIYRPAAIHQLQVVGERAGVKVFEMGQISPMIIAKEAMKFAKDHGHDVVILDTAGRLHIDLELMEELKQLKELTHPDEIMLVVDAMTGQDAVNVAKAFDDALGIDSVLMSKLDSDTRGGAALSVLAVTGTSAWAKSWMILNRSIRNEWHPVFWGWAMC